MDMFDYDRACMQADANLTWGSLGQILGILRGLYISGETDSGEKPCEPGM